MDQVAEELVANDVHGNADLQAKGYDPLTLEPRNALGSPIMCASMRSDWAESSTTDYMATSRMEEKDLSRSAIPLAEAEPPCSILCSVRDGGHVVEELTVGNYRTSHQGLGRSLDSNRQHRWQNIYQLVNGSRDKASHGDYVHEDKEKLLSRAGKQLMKMRSDLWSGLKPLLTKQIGHDSKAISPHSMPGFSQPPLKKVLKGKGVLCRNQEALPECGGADAGPIDGKLDYARKVASDALQTVELVDLAHSQGVAFQDLRPSCFNLLPSNRVIYTGSSTKTEQGVPIPCAFVKKRPLEQVAGSYCSLVPKKQRLGEETKSLQQQSWYSSSSGFGTKPMDGNDIHETGAQDSRFVELHCSAGLSHLRKILVVMLDLRDRILPPSFLSENPREAGFCLWLLHPEPSSRPTARYLTMSVFDLSTAFYYNSSLATNYGDPYGELKPFLQCGLDSSSAIIIHFDRVSEIVKQLRCNHRIVDRQCNNAAPDNDDTEPGQLLHFLSLLKEQKQKHEAKLLVDIECYKKISKSSFSVSKKNEARLSRNINQIKNAYFSMRSQIRHTSSAPPSNKDLLKNRDSLPAVQYNREDSNTNQRSDDPLGAFFEGLCKFASYSRFEVCGSLKNGDFMSSTNVVCTLSFDRDEDYIAAAGISKKIKVFEFGALLNDSIDIHYPTVEMSNKSKISSVCWNNYIKNYLASTDYDGVVQMWDAGTGQRFSQYTEHQKRAWSVDFSLADPMMFVSGSDDCSVKLWSINEACFLLYHSMSGPIRSSIGTIGNPANVCCVQFSPSSTNLLVFGSADYKVYCYDLRHTKIPWCTLAGHGKTVSYVKFLDSETLVSASTDNTLKLWDLNKTSSTGLSSSACSLTFGGHTNEKNFVGLSALDGYIACGSETNEVKPFNLNRNINLKNTFYHRIVLWYSLPYI
ncbi:hypothetical protein POTOM_061597 [Populus tomentosa]|uniref:Uncharacterized protein n=1 Tax=Populus tomentosa TaxID=118781 RepID=A0A8X8BVB5_POPTO|nr:hypothetical protein POTOM_061597 [Populus tomentosa]